MIKPYKIVLASGFAVLAIGTVVYAIANVFADRELESGTKTGNQSTISDATASGGSAVKFGQASGGCSTTNPWAPGGPDPWGGCWPGPDNTGVPAGTTLTAYTGSCTITANNTVIDSKNVQCSPLTVQASNVTITKSLLFGGVNIPSSSCGSASMTLTDVHVDSPQEVGGAGDTGILRCSYTANRVEVTGGRRSMSCVNNCTIENSWVHDQGDDSQNQAHFSGIRMEQNGTIRHNTIVCEGTRSGVVSGCSAGLTGYPDFAPIHHNLIERNMFLRGSGNGPGICAYGGATGGKPYSNDPTNATYIRFIGNRFVRDGAQYCGIYGTISGYDENGTGNEWTDNLYDDGTAVNL